MPNPNAIVSHIIRFEPQLDRPHVEMLSTEGGLFVELEGGRRARLDPADPRSIAFTQILDGLRKLGTPVYLETDPATHAITRLHIPLVTRVVSVQQGREGTLDVELEHSHGRHMLRRGQPDTDALEKDLREAAKNGESVMITEEDDHSIIDVRPYKPGPGAPRPPLLPEAYTPEMLPPGGLPSRIWLWKIWPWWWFSCVTKIRAQQIFNAMKATDCNPLTVTPPCIPFRYPDDGCWARAHEMCRLMTGMGMTPKKVWIRASAGHWLHVDTRNSPNCYVDWGWHVAPTLCVRGPSFFQAQTLVIDPSLFASPVSEASWKSLQGDPDATLTETDAIQYWPNGGTDPAYTDTNIRLAYYRLKLQNRAIQYGPPPYANCP